MIPELVRVARFEHQTQTSSDIRDGYGEPCELSIPAHRLLEREVLLPPG
jgi:hypothetical protein